MKDAAQSGYKPVQADVLKTLGLAVLASGNRVLRAGSLVVST